jgi:type II secretory pathway predicted ATPase ExeA/pSer/pThr/pTyr-binding forkhead associated (FHA) protein
MYLDSFNLKELPFRLSPDPQFLYLSNAHARAKAYMESTIWFTDGFVVITGEIGSGKTTLIETFLRELDKDVVVAQINQTQVSVIEFLQTLLAQFGFNPFRMKKAELLTTLNNFLIEQYAAGRKVLLIVDEAQNLSLRVLEEIRMLSGVETTKEKVLRIILAGQPEMNHKLDAPELVQLTQRVRLRFHLAALSQDDMQGFILHRLEVAGSEGREIFAPDTYDLLYRFTGGVPRLVNTLCDTAMLAAFNDDSNVVTVKHLTDAIEELQWVDYAHRKHTQTMAMPDVDEREPDLDWDTATVARSASSSRSPQTGEPLGRVILSRAGKTVAERRLHVGRLIIGRTGANDLQVESRFISRHHCQIMSNAEFSVLEDLNSTNGVFVKSKRVRHHNLNDGDVISLGDHDLIYIDERPASRAARELADTGKHSETADHQPVAKENQAGKTAPHPKPKTGTALV